MIIYFNTYNGQNIATYSNGARIRVWLTRIMGEYINAKDIIKIGNRTFDVVHVEDWAEESRYLRIRCKERDGNG